MDRQILSEELLKRINIFYSFFNYFRHYIYDFFPSNHPYSSLETTLHFINLHFITFLINVSLIKRLLGHPIYIYISTIVTKHSKSVKQELKLA